MSKTKPFGVFFFAAGALVLHLAFAVGIGALFAQWHGRQISRGVALPQAPRYVLPAGWNDPGKRGQIASLCAAGGHVFAAGPGLGVYRSVDGHSWFPFNAGLSESLETTHLSSGPAGLFVIDDDLQAYRWDSTAWSAIGVVPESSRVVRVGHRGGSLAVATDFGVHFWTERDGWTTPEDPGRAATFAVKPRRVLPATPTLGIGIESNERGAWFVRLSGGSGVAAPPVDPPVDPSKVVWLRDVDGSSTIVDGDWRSTITDVEFRPSPTSTIIVAAGDARVYAIDVVDGGFATPRGESAGLPPAACTSLTVNGEDLFVGTSGFGVYRFDAQHDRFEPANLGLLHTP
ncbi:MAG: hypothetical protein IT350_13950 [Deltaproteobacteria bacterium]|nr:hypothetical protein [Deltaproteobacteria bacterium]